MTDIVFLLFNLFICLFFIYKKNAAILAYIVLIQEVHLIPFDNLGFSSLGHIYYIFIAILFYFVYTNGEISKKRILYIFSDYVVFSIVLLILAFFLHLSILGLQTEASVNLTFRFFSQIVPVLIYIVLVLERKTFLEELAPGIMIFGVLLFFILLLSSDILSMAAIRRGFFREEVGMSPIAVSRVGGIMFITALFMFLDQKKSRYKILLIAVMLVSLLMLVIGMSRGPLIALIISLLVYFLFSEGDKIKRILFLSVSFTALFMLIVLIYDYLNIDTLLVYTERLESLQNYENMRRFRRYILSIDFLKNEFGLFTVYFLFGLGPAGFANYFGMGYAHNIIVEYVFEFGFLGILSITIFSVISMIYGYKIIRSNLPKRFHYIPVIFMFLYLAGMVSGDFIGRRNLLFISLFQVMLVYYYYPLINPNQKRLKNLIKRKDG